MSDSIELSRSERPDDSPAARIGALKVVQMAVDLRFARQGLGEMLLDLAVLRARARAETDAGCRYLILDAKPGRESYYSEYGFLVNEEAQAVKLRRAKSAKRDPAKETISMRFDLRAPGELGLGVELPHDRDSVVGRAVARLGFGFESVGQWISSRARRIR